MIKHVYILLSSLDSGVWKPVSCFSAVSLSHCHLYLGAVEHYCLSYKRLMRLSSRKPCNGALQYFFKEMVACRIVYVNWSDKLLGVMAMAERFRSSNSSSGGSVIVVCVWNPVMTLVSLSKMFRARCSEQDVQSKMLQKWIPVWIEGDIVFERPFGAPWSIVRH